MLLLLLPLLLSLSTFLLILLFLVLAEAAQFSKTFALQSDHSRLCQGLLVLLRQLHLERSGQPGRGAGVRVKGRQGGAGQEQENEGGGPQAVPERLRRGKEGHARGKEELTDHT